VQEFENIVMAKVHSTILMQHESCPVHFFITAVLLVPHRMFKMFKWVMFQGGNV